MEYKKFQEKLIPSVEADKIIGVRTPSLRLIAKRIFNENSQHFNKSNDAL